MSKTPAHRPPRRNSAGGVSRPAIASALRVECDRQRVGYRCAWSIDTWHGGRDAGGIRRALAYAMPYARRSHLTPLAGFPIACDGRARVCRVMDDRAMMIASNITRACVHVLRWHMGKARCVEHVKGDTT